jgi:hypothetical protein
MTLILTVMKKCINNENDTKNYSNNKSAIVIICYYMLLYNNCDNKITWYDNNKASTFDISTRCLGGAPPFSRPRCAWPPPSSAGSGLGYWSFVGRPRCRGLRLRNRKHLGTFDNIWYDYEFYGKGPQDWNFGKRMWKKYHVHWVLYLFKVLYLSCQLNRCLWVARQFFIVLLKWENHHVIIR